MKTLELEFDFLFRVIIFFLRLRHANNFSFFFLASYGIKNKTLLVWVNGGGWFKNFFLQESMLKHKRKKQKESMNRIENKNVHIAKTHWKFECSWTGRERENIDYIDSVVLPFFLYLNSEGHYLSIEKTASFTQ